MTTITTLIQRYEQLKAKRRPWEALWQTIRRYVLPKAHEFETTASRATNSKTKQSAPMMFDSTAAMALERFAALLNGLLTPSHQRWHHLCSHDPCLKEDAALSAWFANVTDRLFAARYQGKGHFAVAQYEAYLSLGAFGTAVLFVDEHPLGGIIYRHVPLAHVYLGQSQAGKVDIIYRDTHITYGQAVRMWPKHLPDHYYDKAKQTPDAITPIVHSVHETFTQKADAQQPVYHSVYFCYASKHIIAQGYYRTFPYIISRYVTTAGEVYGRSPAMMVLADIKLLNEMEKTQLKAIHQQVTPPICVPDDGFSKPLSLSPGAINYGGIDMQGRSLIRPIEITGQLQVSEEKMAQKRRHIEESFLVHLANHLPERTNVTATHVMQHMKAKQQMLHPLIVKQQHDMLEPLIRRELDILMHQGQLDHSYGNDVLEECKIHFDSPVNQYQRMERADHILQLLQTIKPLTDQQPELLQSINGAALMHYLKEAYGIPDGLVV